MMRLTHCKIRQDDGSWFTDDGQVTITGDSPAARVAIFTFDGVKMVQTDRLENTEVAIDGRTGEISVTGDSVYLRQNQGVALRVKMTAIPGPGGCEGCG